MVVTFENDQKSNAFAIADYKKFKYCLVIIISWT